MECLSLWPTYIGEKGRTLAKTCEIKARCHWEHIGNLMGTCWEPGKMKRNPPPNPCPTQNLKEKKLRHFECMLSLPIGSMKFVCSKTVRHHFWPGYATREFCMFEMASNLYPSTVIWRSSFSFKKKNPLMSFASRFGPSLFGDISSIIKKLLGPNVPAFINILRSMS